MKTAISIPDPLFEAAEIAARRLGISRSELFQRAIAAYLSHRNAVAITEALNEIYETDREISRPEPILTALQTTSLEHEVW